MVRVRRLRPSLILATEPRVFLKAPNISEFSGNNTIYYATKSLVPEFVVSCVRNSTKNYEPFMEKFRDIH